MKAGHILGRSLIRIAAALLATLPGALATSSPATAQRLEARKAPSAIWARGYGRIRFVAGRISFPERPGAVALTQFLETSNHGRGLDNSVEFRSPDRALRATVYIYAPNLPHAGLSAFATDTFIRAHPELAPRRTAMRLVPAGGHNDAAIRIDYANFAGRMASSAAFLKIGQWIVKLRVSGPEARRAEVERTITALLEELRFDGTDRPRPPELLDPDVCADPPRARAAAQASMPADALEEALTGTVESDRQAREVDGESLLTPRFGPAWCLSTQAHIGRSAPVPFLRSQMPPEGLRQRSVIVVPLTDSGRVLEVVEMPRRRRFVAFHHEIGRTELLGAFGSIPTDEQVADLLSRADSAGSRVRAVIERGADGNVNVTVIRPAAPLSRPTS